MVLRGTNDWRLFVARYGNQKKPAVFRFHSLLLEDGTMKLKLKWCYEGSREQFQVYRVKETTKYKIPVITVGGENINVYPLLKKIVDDIMSNIEHE